MGLLKFRLLTVASLMLILLQNNKFYPTLPDDMEERVGTLLCLCSYFLSQEFGLYEGTWQGIIS